MVWSIKTINFSSEWIRGYYKLHQTHSCTTANPLNTVLTKPVLMDTRSNFHLLACFHPTVFPSFLSFLSSFPSSIHRHFFPNPSIYPLIHPFFLPSFHPAYIPSFHSSLLPSFHPYMLPIIYPSISSFSYLSSTYPSFLPSIHPSFLPSNSLQFI